ncbi:twin-arginine translocase TatA/TatE family subunit [Zavarzinia sp. CC-PAN008]|uniref:twin-arginine translocase TatA/TatE family subunit n=1 Tax=Zavarzinia sp. CC-PAN008 TaxID=3243332 RepID=UPI003F747321
MGAFSFWHILVVVLLVVVLFGRGKISGLMGDVAKGIRNFRTTMSDDDKAPPPASRAPDAPPSVIEAPKVDDRPKV